MYLPRHFEQTDRARLVQAMREDPLATLVVAAPDGPTADLVPLLHLDRADHAAPGRLQGHVARANPLWRHAGCRALALFRGPDAYVSPGWYASKREHGKAVPTWNYTLVQARGTLRVIDDAAWLRDLVTRLTERHEAAQAVPWRPADAPDDYLQQMLGAIVGIEIELTSLVGKWKVSQNRSDADREGVAAALAAHGGTAEAAMAALVRPPAGDKADPSS